MVLCSSCEYICLSLKYSLAGVGMDEKYYIINKNVLPSVFEKVVYVKRLLYTGECKTVNEATRRAGISRSAFYKYKDCVSVYVEKGEETILTMNFILSDRKGVLSNLLTLLSNFGASILTINQNIPFDDIAPATVSLSTKELTCSTDELVAAVSEMDGVLKADVISKN